MTVPNTPPPPSAAELLLQARLSKDLSLDQVSLQTRIPREQIQALEEKNWSVLPGAPYARAFCKTLAAAYELDPELVLAGLRHDMGIKPSAAPRSGVEINLNSKSDESESSRTPLILAVILAFALVLVLAATRFAFKPGQPLAPGADSLLQSGDLDSSSFDSTSAPGLVAAAELATKAARPKAATLKLTDTARPTFLLYIRPGVARIRKKNLTASDTLVFDPDTALYIRNLSRQPLKLSGALDRDSVVYSFFRVFRKNDSAVVEPISEMTWDEKARPILSRNKSLPRR